MRKRNWNYTNAVFAVSSQTNRTNRRDQMPKDATKNVDRYKIRGGHFNEFEYTENQKAVAKEKSQSGAKLIPGTPPEKAGDGLRPTVKTAAKKSTTKSGK